MCNLVSVLCLLLTMVIATANDASLACLASTSFGTRRITGIVVHALALTWGQGHFGSRHKNLRCHLNSEGTCCYFLVMGMRTDGIVGHADSARVAVIRSRASRFPAPDTHHPATSQAIGRGTCSRNRVMKVHNVTYSPTSKTKLE
jgi:hypothetical protein